MSFSNSTNSLLLRWETTLRQSGQRPAILSSTGSVLRRFCQIERESRRWEWALQEEPAEVIALQLENCLEWPEVLLGCWRAGKAVVVFDTGLHAASREHLEKICGVGLRLEWQNGEIEGVSLPHSAPRWPSVRPDLLKVSSGTTTEPKAIQFTAAQLLADCDNICDSMGLAETDINYASIPFSHSYGFSNLITPLLGRGIALALGTDTLPRAMLQGMEQTKATVLPAIPVLLSALSELEGLPETIRLVISAGSNLPASLATTFHARHGRKIHSFYGASECGGICFDASPEIAVPEGYVGEPLRGVHLLLDDPKSEESTVTVSGNAVGLGYWPPDLDASLSSGQFRPSDLLSCHHTGFKLVGRLSDWINIGGKKVNPLTIERALKELSGIKDVVVFGVQHGSRGESIHACVVPSSLASEEILREACHEILPAWQVPRHFHLVSELPVNARGKINRRALREQYAN